ncbi:hypothetical protein ADMFC3_14030 [Geovibrio sp. ADMFC3]|jgi:hypothetical protein|nr:hypothetical protein [Deferribacteraceae bacterium]
MSDTCGCGSGGCGGHDHDHEIDDESMVSMAFAMEKEFMDEINQACEVNGMSFEEFVYSCLEVGIGITNGDLHLIDSETGEKVE